MTKLVDFSFALVLQWICANDSICVINLIPLYWSIGFVFKSSETPITGEVQTGKYFEGDK